MLSARTSASNRATGDRRQHDLAGRPADVGAFALEELAVATVGDPVEALHRVNDLGEVFAQKIVAIECLVEQIVHAAPTAEDFTNPPFELRRRQLDPFIHDEQERSNYLL